MLAHSNMNKNTTRQKLKIAKAKHYFESALEFLIEHNFEDSEHFHVQAEVRKYSPDVFIEAKAQKEGKLPNMAEIYYKGEYVCEVNETMNPKQVIDRIVFALSLKPDLQVQKDILDLSRL